MQKMRPMRHMPPMHRWAEVATAAQAAGQPPVFTEPGALPLQPYYYHVEVEGYGASIESQVRGVAHTRSRSPRQTSMHCLNCFFAVQ